MYNGPSIKPCVSHQVTPNPISDKANGQWCSGAAIEPVLHIVVVLLREADGQVWGDPVGMGAGQIESMVVD